MRAPDASVVGLLLPLVLTDRDVAARHPQLAELVLERLSVHAEDGGRARYVAARLLKAARDVAPLELATVFAEVGRERDAQPAFDLLRRDGPGRSRRAR